MLYFVLIIPFKLKHFGRYFTEILGEEQLSGDVTIISLARYLTDMICSYVAAVICRGTSEIFRKTCVLPKLMCNVHIYIFAYLCIVFYV